MGWRNELLRIELRWQNRQKRDIWRCHSHKTGLFCLLSTPTIILPDTHKNGGGLFPATQKTDRSFRSTHSPTHMTCAAAGSKSANCCAWGRATRLVTALVQKQPAHFDHRVHLAMCLCAGGLDLVHSKSARATLLSTSGEPWNQNLHRQANLPLLLFDHLQPATNNVFSCSLMSCSSQQSRSPDRPESHSDAYELISIRIVDHSSSFFGFLNKPPLNCLETSSAIHYPTHYCLTY